jgi:glycosyltransferase involved in cell wall biosynthesis
VRAGRHGVIRKTAEGLTAGFYAPLPPARTGVADYGAALLGALRRHGEVRNAPAQCETALYHLGNNALHAGIYRRALEAPGVVVLHDAVLHHFLLGQLPRDAYIEEFAYNYGGWHRSLAEELWVSRAGSGSDSRYFQFPMLKRVAERSRAVVVHNPAAARLVREHAPRTPVVEIPHFFSAPELPTEVQALRYRVTLGFKDRDFLFGVFGYLRESKRVGNILEVFRAVHSERPETGLLVAGAFVSADLERAVRPMLRAPGIVYRPHLPEREYRLAASAIDACINLRYPAAGETSGISIGMMGIGKPVLVTESEECARFPEDACLRVAPGLEERDSLRSQMILLRSFPGVGRAVGVRAAAHVRAHHNLERVAQQYWTTLCEYRC